MNTRTPHEQSLQNHPTERTLPVRNSLRYVGHQPGQPVFLGYFAMALIPLLVIASLVLMSVDGGLIDAIKRSHGNVVAGIDLMVSHGGGPVLGWTLLPLLFAVLLIPGIIKGRSGPREEQLRYYRLREEATGKSNPFAQEKVLRVGAAISYENRWWPRTVEPWPLERFGPGKPMVELPASQRFATMEFVSQQQAADMIHQQWGIESRKEFLSVLRTNLEYGEQSLSFALLTVTGGPHVLPQLAEQLQVAPEELARAAEGQEVPQLMWAYDWGQVHTLIRYGYAAEYLDDKQTKRFLSIVTRYIAALFTSEREFLANYRLGAAYAAANTGNSRVGHLEKLHEQYVEQWVPQLSDWPTGAVTDLPETVLTGFAKERAEAAPQEPEDMDEQGNATEPENPEPESAINPVESPGDHEDPAPK